MRTVRIPLSRGFAALVDEADAPLVAGFAWRFRPGKRTGYAAGRKRPGRKTEPVVMMHRLILSAPDGVPVDHINGDGLDNRRENLRLCNRVENARNRRGPQTTHGRTPSSRFKGVSLAHVGNWQRWKASIRVDGRSLYLGVFRSEIDAARAYNRAASEHFGAFARLNPIESED